MTITNSRYINYARYHGRTPEEQLEQDRKDWPGGTMVGFTQWNRGMMLEYSKTNPNGFLYGALIDHDGYDAWLSEQVPEC